MAQITNLNVAPYYDDFDENDRFHKVLFRPGYAVQARELTTLQSILQNQVEKHGMHIFKEGTVVIPGQVSYSGSYYSLALESTFGGEDINVSQFYNADSPVLLTGATSGVKAQVIGFAAGTTTTQPYLYLQYVQTGDDKISNSFLDSENLSADVTITHTTSYAAAVASVTTFSSNAANVGSAVTATLPASPTLGAVCRFIDATGQAATNNITIARNSEKIQGAAANLTIATNRAAIGLVYYNSTHGWVLIEN